MDARLYTIPGSHPGLSARLMLEHKAIPYRRVDLLPVISKGVVKAQRFDEATVPAMKIDGRRVQGSLAIARELEVKRPDPPLFPADPELCAAVIEAERFGDAELQHPIRQILWWALKRDASPLRGFSQGAKLGIPIEVAVRTAAPIVAMAARFSQASDKNVRGAIAGLPALLDRVDSYAADGVLDGDELNAADFQIAPSIALAMTLDDLRPHIESRRSGRLARRLVPDYPGRIPPVLPPAWLEPLRG